VVSEDGFSLLTTHYSPLTKETQMARPGPQRPAAGPEEIFPGADYSDDEREFLVAVERYRREKRRPFPTCREVLQLLLGLGYRRVAEPPPPVPRKETD
jgi:hypothetical protein